MRVLYITMIFIICSFLQSSAQEDKVDYPTYSLAQEKDEKIQKHHFKKIYDKRSKRFRLIKDTVIIQFPETAKIETIKPYLDNLGLEIVSNLGKQVYLCKLKETDNESLVSKLNYIQALIQEENGSSFIEGFDLNEYKRVQVTDLDESIAHLEWHLNNDGINGLKKGADINASKAWEYTQGDLTKIAVIDTGIDLKLKKKVNIFEKGVNARTVDQSLGAEESLTAIAPKNSKENHATAIIGIINAKGKDGLMGIAPNSTVIPIRLIDDSGLVSTAQIIYAFQKADEVGAQIINCSWGSRAPLTGVKAELSDMEKNLYKEIAVKGNHNNGIVIVFAAGNKGSRDLNYSPEARYWYNFAVGASDSSDTITSYSNLGRGLDVIAPGGDTNSPIYTYDREDLTKNNRMNRKSIQIQGYNEGSIAKNFKGTSAAAAIVSGVAALVHSSNPDLSAREIKHILRSTADPIDCPVMDQDYACGTGRINAAKALEYSSSNFPLKP